MTMVVTASTSCGSNASYLGSSNMTISSRTYKNSWQDLLAGVYKQALVRNRAAIAMTNLVYNMVRFEQIERLGLKNWKVA